MKKVLLACTLFILFTINIFGQTATSVANGDWTMPTTWDCMCVPLNNYTITINHNVILNTDYAITGGSLTIGTNGILSDNAPLRQFAINNVTTINNGKISIDRIAFYGGTITNNDSITNMNALYMDAEMINNGVINDIDSLG